ncbi:unnamed protein product [Symbiodinium natans]|uniref:MAPEG family protein n=1 Tax=Symbiodinium natans TaxID=878477 RepID=A0A812JE48_9DINO|nr:unnamed protein product [Symbiodinium natans]
MRPDGFELPCAATAVFILHYVFVDTFAVGAARTPYQLKYPFTTETEDPKLLEPFIRSLRAQQNQVEQAWAFFLAMWVCAVFLDPMFSGIFAWIWVIARMAYAYIYRVSPSRNRLMWATVPAYVSQAAVCGGILTSLLPFTRPIAAASSALIVFAFAAYGWLVYRSWFGNFVLEEKKRLENQLIAR